MKEKVYIHIQIRKDVHDSLVQEAEQKGMSLNSYVNLIISERKK